MTNKKRLLSYCQIIVKHRKNEIICQHLNLNNLIYHTHLINIFKKEQNKTFWSTLDKNIGCLLSFLNKTLTLKPSAFDRVKITECVDFF